jgi:SAM-dependent methyltransferase
MNFRKIKNVLRGLVRFPIHPQWHAYRNKRLFQTIEKIVPNSTVLDIGCFNKWAQKLMPPGCFYIGLDYPETATEWYKSFPDIFGDALKLPIQKQSIDVVLLLDVIEHLEDANLAIQEAERVLKNSGKIIVQIPFLYPIHDAPRDYSRLTKYGIYLLAKQNNLKVTDINFRGTPLETAAIFLNIAASTACIDLFSRKNPLSILILPLLPLLFVLNNLLSFCASFFLPNNDLMPFSYLFTLEKHDGQQD